MKIVCRGIINDGDDSNHAGANADLQMLTVLVGVMVMMVMVEAVIIYSCQR